METGAKRHQKRGHPLRRVSTGKKVSVPNFFFFGLTTAAQEPFRSALLEPVISSFDFGPFSLEAIRSVTHLVLARGGR